jgi:hypothetical protein
MTDPLNQISLQDSDAPAIIELGDSQTPEIIEIFAVGPQGPPGRDGSGASSLAELSDLNSSGKVDRSLIYFDGPTGQFKADSAVTTLKITDGGNF